MDKKRNLANYILETDINFDLEDYRWIYLFGIKTKYIITNNGIIYSIRNNKIKRLKSRPDKDNYLHVIIHLNGVKYYRSVHRLVAEAFIPNPENKPQVNHKDGNHLNNFIDNLEWVTCKENIHHAWKTGLSTAQCGENHPNSIYTNNQIELVCELLEKNENSMIEISNLTNVSYTVVKQIRNRFLWKSISCNYHFENYSVSKKQKYTIEQIEYVCKLIDEGDLTLVDISRKTNVPCSTISSIYRCKSWKKISSKYNFYKRKS